MAKSGAERALADLIGRLRAERQEHIRAIATIDQTFEQFGIAAGGGRGRRAKDVIALAGIGRGRKRRRRGTFSTTGEQAVLSYVKKHGSPSAADVNKFWKSQGRGGKADNTLSKLVKEGSLKRAKKKGERGARYVSA